MQESTYDVLTPCCIKCGRPLRFTGEVELCYQCQERELRVYEIENVEGE